MMTTACKAAWLAMLVLESLLASGPSVAQPPNASPDMTAKGETGAVPAGQRSLSVPDPYDPKQSTHLTGQVVGTDGKPLPGARIFYFAPESESGARARKTVRAVTGSDGYFEFDAPDMAVVDVDGLPSRQQGVLIATADGYGPDWRWIWGNTKSGFRWKRPNADLVLQLARDDVPVHGRLLDADGRPLAGATVRLAGLHIPRRNDLDAHLAREARLSLFSTTDYERSLHPAAMLPGMATELETDSGGRFTIWGLGRDRFVEVSVSAPTIVEATIQVMTRDAPDVSTRLGVNDKPTSTIYGAGFNLRLNRGRTIVGLVIDRDSREPIPGMWVGLGSEGHPREGILWNRTVTGADGAFAITGVTPGDRQWSITAVSPPGTVYLPAGVEVKDDSPVVVECQRGIPFRLKVVDDEGRPVEAVVTYNDVYPNPNAPRPWGTPSDKPMARAARDVDGTYRGFAVAGPGAVLVQTPDRPDYLPADVNPKAFFEPGRTHWSKTEQALAYGTSATIAVSAGSPDQNDYAAIVLVNPTADSGPLELSATIKRRAPRRATLIDTNGEPVVGARLEGTQFDRWSYERPLRTASFSLSPLHPKRFRRMTFFKEDQRLVGFLFAQGDDEVFTVRMQPWSAVKGRIVDINGKPLAFSKPVRGWKGPAMLFVNEPFAVPSPDCERGEASSAITDDDGHFRIDRLVPGLRYSARVFGGVPGAPSPTVGIAFDKLVLQPGEVRDLGDVRVNSPLDAEAGT